MTVKHQADAMTLGRRYAEIVRERDLPVTGLWVSNEEGTPFLWITIQIREVEGLRPVVRGLIELQRQFIETEFDRRVLVPDWIPGFDERSQIPAHAMRIELGE